MTRKQRRGIFIAGGMAVLGIAVTLILYSLSDSITYYYGPTDVVQKNIQPGTRIRLGGMVTEGSVKRGANTQVEFAVTDGNKTLNVSYTGILPDLFREKQGVITEGKLNTDGLFVADSVLAKHDEKYVPREVADTLKKQGYWKKDSASAGAPPKAASQ